MRRCATCGRAYPEVQGAPEQACPHCGATVATPIGAAATPFVDGPVDPWAAASLAFRLWSRHLFALLALWLPAFAVSAATSLTLAWYLASSGFPPDLTGMSDAQRLEVLGVALPLISAAVVVELAMWGLVGAFVAERTGVAGARRAALARAPTLLGLGLLLTFAYIAGALLLIVPFLVFLHWFLFAPAAAAEGAGVGKALEASRAFARERKTYGFTALVVLTWVALIAAQLILAPAVAFLLGASGLAAAYADALAASLVAWPFQPLLALLPASYWHLAKSAGPTSGAPAAPIAPDAPAAERFRTTKCPQCGTLVPYTATGQPVDITCPVCGRAGRVL